MSSLVGATVKITLLNLEEPKETEDGAKGLSARSTPEGVNWNPTD